VVLAVAMTGGFLPTNNNDCWFTPGVLRPPNVSQHLATPRFELRELVRSHDCRAVVSTNSLPSSIKKRNTTSEQKCNEVTSFFSLLLFLIPSLRKILPVLRIGHPHHRQSSPKSAEDGDLLLRGRRKRGQKRKISFIPLP
jgi:hypothetical protein